MGERLQNKEMHQNNISRRNNINSDTPKAKANMILEENKDDLIGNLPDEILCRIISFLGPETAVQTSCLSTRWRGLWNMTSPRHGIVEDIADEIHGFLTDFVEVNPLRLSWRHQFHFGREDFLLATIPAFGELHLDFSMGERDSSRQFDWELELIGQKISQQLSMSTKFVNTLHLNSVSYLTSNIVSTVVSSFQFLENLKITECVGLRSLRIDAGVKLRYLTILDCPQLNDLYIKPCNLQSLRYRGLFPSFWLELDNFYGMARACLTDVMLDFRKGPGSDNFHPRKSFLSVVLNSKILTLCYWTFEAIISQYLSSDFGFYVLKELWWIDNSVEEYKIDALVSFLKACPSLEKLYITIDPTSYCSPSKGKCSKPVTRHTQLGQLNMVYLEGFTNQEDLNLLVDHLNMVITVEQIIIATSHGNRVLSMVKDPSFQSDSMQLKKSEGKMVAPRRQKRNWSYKLVEEAADHSSEMCSKHPHMGL